MRNHVDQTMVSLSPDEQDTAAKILDRLVTPSGAKIAQSFRDLVAFPNLSGGQLEPLLTRLSDDRILRRVGSSADQDSQRYQIFHDAWVPAIQHWRTTYAAERAVREAQKGSWRGVNLDFWRRAWAQKGCFPQEPQVDESNAREIRVRGGPAGIPLDYSTSMGRGRVSLPLHPPKNLAVYTKSRHI